MPPVNSVLTMTTTLLISSFVHRVGADASDATDSDEDSALREALLLVDILKSEYAKVLQENNDLRSGANITAELSTCPTTKATNSTTTLLNLTTIILPPQNTPAGRPPETTTENIPNYWSPPPYFRRNARNYRGYRPRYYRRYLKMPLDYYYYGLDKFRRFSYEDPFGLPPNDTGSPIVIISTNATTTSVTTRAIESKTNKKTTTSITTNSMKTSSQTKTILNINSKAEHSSEEAIQKLHLMLPIRHEDISTTADPVISQVASELIHEFGSGPSSFRPSHINLIQSTNKNFNLGMTRNLWQYKPLKTSLRIHLSRSTKFPIPYPDNHAFCYTNPENALCRTLIK